MYPSVDKNVVNTLAVQDDQNVNYVPACKRTYCTKRKQTRSLVPRPLELKKTAWYPLFAHVQPSPEKPGDPV